MKDLSVVLAFIFGCVVGAIVNPETPSPPPSQPTVSIAVAPEGKPISVNSSWSFFSADYDKDGVLDLWIIKQAQTGTSSTEVHILKGPDFQTFILHTGTPLHETPNFVVPITLEKHD